MSPEVIILLPILALILTWLFLWRASKNISKTLNDLNEQR